MIIIDTGAFLALFNKRDTHHAIAQQAYHAVQRNFLKAICQNAFQVFQIEQNHLERMVELMERYADLPMDLADASLVVLAEHLGHGRILTVDRRDFSTYRWNNNQPFQNLLFNP